jgi:hypothetical protein
MRSWLWLIGAVSAGLIIGLASTVARDGMAFGSRPAFAQDNNADNPAGQLDQQDQPPAEGAESGADQQDPNPQVLEQQQTQGGTEQNIDPNPQDEQGQDATDNQNNDSQPTERP